MWYSNKIYNKKIYINHLLLLLIKVYLTYGLNIPKHVYTNNYWFNYRVKYATKTNYYRWSVFTNEMTGEQSRYRFRTDSGLFYQTRVSLFSYNRWLLVLTQWFEPDKQRLKRLTRLSHKNFENTLLNFPKKQAGLSRFVLLRKLILTSRSTCPSLYKF